MSYYRSKMINGNGPYWYEVESVRHGDTVQQKHIRYIGKNRPTRVGAGQTTVRSYDRNPGETIDIKGRSKTKKWTPERKRRAEIVAEQAGCSVVEADGLIRRAKSKGYDYDEVDWDELQGKDLEYSERVEKLEKQVGDTRTRKEAKAQNREASRSMRESEKKRLADGDNYDPEDDLEIRYAYEASKADYYEERAAQGHRSGGRGWSEETA